MIELIIFDLDGTLVDSSVDLTNALNYAIAPYDIEQLTVQNTISLVGEGITRLIEKLLGPEKNQVRQHVMDRFKGWMDNLMIANRGFSEVEVTALLNQTLQPPVLPMSGPLQVSTPAVVDLNGTDASIGSLAGNGRNTNSVDNALTLTVGYDGITTSFGGSIAATNLTLVKVGSGLQALGGANRYRGETLVNAGTLWLAGGSLDTSLVKVAGGQTFGSVPPKFGGAGAVAGTVNYLTKSCPVFTNGGTALDSLEAKVVAGSEGAKQPFWSPDSQSLVYFANGSLMKVALASGAPVRICDAPEARGGTWSRSGVIVFTPAPIDTALGRVSADGGHAEPATILDVSQGESSHRWPAFLPDGVHFLYFVHSSLDERRGVYLGRVDRPASLPASPLFRSESEAVYAPLSGRERGVLFSVANGRVAARPFDAARLALGGDPRMIDLPAGRHTIYHAAMLSASADVLVAVSSPILSGSRLASSGRNGEDLRLWKEREPQFWPRLSPATGENPFLR